MYESRVQSDSNNSGMRIWNEVNFSIPALIPNPTAVEYCPTYYVEPMEENMAGVQFTCVARGARRKPGASSYTRTRLSLTVLPSQQHPP